MNKSQSDLLVAIAQWIDAKPAIQSAVLFGSSANQMEDATGDDWSDIDLHIVTADAEQLEHVDWARALPNQRFVLQIVRPATGGVKKVTALFAVGQIDLVIIPAATMRSVQSGMRQGLHRAPGSLREALNEMATCLWWGYRFLKGEGKWGKFYATVAAEMPGVRLSNKAAEQMADVFLCDLLWTLQKLERGELSAAQHQLHRSLADINFRLIRELQLRRKLPLHSFGLGRHVEEFLPSIELQHVQVSSRLRRAELRKTVWKTFRGLKYLMRRLDSTWRVPKAMDRLLAPHRVGGG